MLLPRYVTYGEQEWREATEACLRGMELYDDNGEGYPLCTDNLIHTVPSPCRVQHSAAHAAHMAPGRDLLSSSRTL